MCLNSPVLGSSVQSNFFLEVVAEDCIFLCFPSPGENYLSTLFSPESPDCHDVDDYPGPSPICQVVHSSGYTPISSKIEQFI